MKRLSGQIRDLQTVVMDPGSLVIPLRFGDSMASKSAAEVPDCLPSWIFQRSENRSKRNVFSLHIYNCVYVSLDTKIIYIDCLEW